MTLNREIPNERLLAEAVDEVVASARENDVPVDEIAGTLRSRARVLEKGPLDSGGDAG